MLMVHYSKKHYFVHVRLVELLKEYTKIHAYRLEQYIN